MTPRTFAALLLSASAAITPAVARAAEPTIAPMVAHAPGPTNAPMVAPATQVRRIDPPIAPARAGDRVEQRIDVAGAFTNPFDPDEIAVSARITAPSGAVVDVPAFYTQSVDRSLSSGVEVLAPRGPRAFAVRWRAREPGRHRVVVVARERGGAPASAVAFVDIARGAAARFVTVDPRYPRSLAFDDGAPYVPVGANVAWSVSRAGGFDLDVDYRMLAAAGCTWTRLWLTDYGDGWTIEAPANHRSHRFHGPGAYALDVATRIDHAFERAEELGIAIDWVLWQHAQFESDSDSSWASNPYAAANGGPAADSASSFADAGVRRLAKMRARYLVARYAAFTSLFAWEVMNEEDAIRAPRASVRDFVDDVARTLRALDPYHHLVTTSFRALPSPAQVAVYAGPLYDVAQAHVYAAAPAPAIASAAAVLASIEKPAILAEYGLDPTGAADARDPRGAHLGEGSWVAWASGFSGGAMSWWWDTALRPNDLYATQAPFAALARQIDVRGMEPPLPASVRAVAADGTPLPLYGRASGARLVAYVDVDRAAAVPVHGASLSVPVAAPLRRVTFFDPARGVSLASVDLGAGAGGAVPLPDFLGEIVVDVRAVPVASPRERPPPGCSGCTASAAARLTPGPCATLAPFLLISFRRRFHDRRGKNDSKKERAAGDLPRHP